MSLFINGCSSDILLSFTYNFIVFSGGDQIHDHIKCGKCQERKDCTENQKFHIPKPKTAHKDFFYQMESKTAVDSG